MDWHLNQFPSLHIKQAAYTCVEARAPWGLDFIPYHHTKFGLVTEGSCWIDLKNGEAPIKLSRGSCYLLTRGDAFRLRDDTLSDAVDFAQLLPQLQGRVLRLGKAGALSIIMGGRFIFAEDRYPLVLDLLPPLIHFQVSASELTALTHTIALLANETSQPGLASSEMVNRLADIFFIQTLRAYSQSNQSTVVQTLGSAADAQLCQALRLMHQHYQQPWQIATLAQQVGMSRAVFAARFKQKLGTTPQAYLTRYRLEQAKHKLQHSQLTLAQIAHEVGYGSEAALSKAFKREFGVGVRVSMASHSTLDRQKTLVS